MEWSLQYDEYHQPVHAVEMTQKHTALAFLGRRSLVPRPLSEATVIFDTDNEEDFDELSPLSWQSRDDDSQSTISSRDELPTPPHTGGLGGFEFHFDDKAVVVGPQGPHLFQSTPELLSTPANDAFIGMSPMAAPVQEPKTPSRPFNTLNTAVAELDESQVRDWSPAQVAEWMAEAGFETSVVEKFLIHDISGNVLIDLQFEDLKELDISSFGKRHRVMSSIQQLRSSSMFTMEAPIQRSPSSTPSRNLNSRSPRTLQRAARPEECHVVPDRSLSRRRVRKTDIVTPAESVSIVGIEQVLPKEHHCAKGEDCPKWQKQQRRILRMQEAFEEDARQTRPVSQAVSEALPSVVGSSDVLGPSSVKITAESLSEVQPRDPQESIRQFIHFQHLHPYSQSSNPSPPPAASATFAAKSANLDQHLKDLPKLTIPDSDAPSETPARTPISALQQPTQLQSQLKAQLIRDPYHYGGVASPADIYRIHTPMSATDIPVTALPVDPCQRDVSQSVPPEMRYGEAPASSLTFAEPIQRSASTAPVAPRRHHRQPSFTPSVAPVRETETAKKGKYPSHRVTEIDLANHQGWLAKRTKTRMLHHEWKDHYCTLVGSKLTLHDTHFATANEIESLDVDGYILHAYTQASSNKLSAAFKKSILGSGRDPAGEHAFAFSLVPENDKKSMFEKSKTHHFAADSSKERVEWMRKLMLAKAMKKNEGVQI